MVNHFQGETVMTASLDRTATVQRAFGPAAASYATCAIHARGPDLDALLAAAEPDPAARALDVGCGAGHTALLLASHVCHVVALDLSQEMLAQSRALATQRGLENLSFEVGAAESLPFPDASFDLVSSRLCAHHYADPARATEQAARVLRPGGRYLLVDTLADEDPAQDTFINALELLRDPSHVRNHTRAQWQAWFERAGLRFELVAVFPLRIEFEPWLERIGTSPQARAMLATMLHNAPSEIRAALELRGESGCDFTQASALMVGYKPACG
jgi:ubiquinone/menaquinone biosynthesis C-methylase UbiE